MPRYTYNTFRPPPISVPRRRAMNGSSDVTGPHPRSSPNWIGMAPKFLAQVSELHSLSSKSALTGKEFRRQKKRRALQESRLV